MSCTYVMDAVLVCYISNPGTNRILYKLDFYKILILEFIFMGTYAAFIGALPVYLADRGETKFLIGTIIASYSLGEIFFLLFLSNHINQTKVIWLFIIASALLMLSIPLLLIVENNTFYIISRFIHGVSCAVFYSAANFWIVLYAPKEERANLLGQLGMVTGLSVVVFPPLGLLILEHTDFKTLVHACVLFALIILPFLGVKYKTETAQSSSMYTGGYLIILSECLMLFTLSAAIGILQSFLPFFLQAKNIDNIIMIYATFGIMLAAGRLLGGKGELYIRVINKLRLCSILIFLTLITIVYSNAYLPFLLATAAYGLATGVAFTAAIVQVSNKTDRLVNQGQLLAYTTLAIVIGLACGPLISGFIAYLFGDSLSYIEYSAVVLSILGILFSFSITSRDKKYDCHL